MTLGKLREPRKRLDRRTKNPSNSAEPAGSYDNVLIQERTVGPLEPSPAERVSAVGGRLMTWPVELVPPVRLRHRCRNWSTVA